MGSKITELIIPTTEIAPKKNPNEIQLLIVFDNFYAVAHVTKSKTQNFSTEIYIKINKDFSRDLLYA